MNKDKLVIDIETKNTFADIGGQENLEKLDVSFIGAYSYNQDKYLSFKENELENFGPILQNAGLIIGFAINRFDLPVLKKYYNFNVMALPRLDLLEEVELAYGQRVSLDVLAKANLQISKSGHGLDAIEFYKKGDWQALADYCLQDVKVTKELYDFIKKEEHILIPKKYTEEIVKVSVKIKETEPMLQLF